VRFREILRGTQAPVLMSLAVLALMSGCAAPGRGVDQVDDEVDAPAPVVLSPKARVLASALLRTPVKPGWSVYRWPGKRMAAFEADRVMGRDALRVDSRGTVSVLRQKFEPALKSAGVLRFSWKAQSLPVGADLRDSGKEDAAVRVVLAFDGDRSLLSERAQRLSDLSLALTGEPLPYATLVYVWSETEPVGTVIHNPRTDRIRKLVVSSGRDALGRWKDHERDVQADFRLVFGEASGDLLSLALMSDTDNTRSQATVWFGGLQLTP
jgi:hypothetical protein